MRAFLIAVLLSLVSIGASAADRCSPVADLVLAASARNVKAIVIYEGKDVNAGFIASYTAAIHLPPPPDSKPIGAIFVTVGEATLFGLVEPGNCVIYSVTLATKDHKRALDLASTGA